MRAFDVEAAECTATADEQLTLKNGMHSPRSCSFVMHLLTHQLFSSSLLRPFQQPIQTLLILLQILFMHILRPPPLLVPTPQLPLSSASGQWVGKVPLSKTTYLFERNSTSTLILRVHIVQALLLWTQGIRAPLVEAKIF